MKLSEDFEVVQNNSSSFSLIETYVGKTKDGKKKKIQKRESYYGTLYQALQGFLHQSVGYSESLGDVRGHVYGAMMMINRAKAELKREFRTEVREAR